MKFQFFAILAIAAITSLEGSLPPLYQSIREYKAVLDSQELINSLSSADPILDIQRTDHGFIVTSLKKTVNLSVVYEPSTMPGPAKFHIELLSSTDR